LIDCKHVAHGQASLIAQGDGGCALCIAGTPRGDILWIRTAYEVVHNTHVSAAQSETSAAARENQKSLVCTGTAERDVIFAIKDDSTA
jgi:hypothetical protein